MSVNACGCMRTTKMELGICLFNLICLFLFVCLLVTIWIEHTTEQLVKRTHKSDCQYYCCCCCCCCNSKFWRLLLLLLNKDDYFTQSANTFAKTLLPFFGRCAIRILRNVTNLGDTHIHLPHSLQHHNTILY